MARTVIDINKFKWSCLSAQLSTTSRRCTGEWSKHISNLGNKLGFENSCMSWPLAYSTLQEKLPSWLVRIHLTSCFLIHFDMITTLTTISDYHGNHNSWLHIQLTAIAAKQTAWDSIHGGPGSCVYFLPGRVRVQRSYIHLQLMSLVLMWVIENQPWHSSGYLCYMQEFLKSYNLFYLWNKLQSMRTNF
jgi:hypothetical protein